MTDNEKQDFCFAIRALTESFGVEATEPMLHGYWLGLSDLSIKSVQLAVARGIRESPTLPRPADLRRFSGIASNDDKAVAAWGDVLKAVTHGPYKHIDFCDRLCNATIRNLGGWPMFVGRFENGESEKWVRLDFLKTYRAFANSGVNGEACEALPGINEAEVHNGIVGIPIPILIGCDDDRIKLPCLLKTSASRLPFSLFQRIESKNSTSEI